MSAIAVIAGLVFAAISAVHVLWALGIWWPVRDERALARSVAGFKGIDAMPARAASLAVAVATSGLAFLAFMLARIVVTDLPGWLVGAAGVAASAVLLARGAIGFTARWAAITPEQPFRHLDKRYFSPLCLLLGLAFGVITWGFAS
jgi:hypothetical protein